MGINTSVPLPKPRKVTQNYKRNALLFCINKHDPNWKESERCGLSFKKSFKSGNPSKLSAVYLSITIEIFTMWAQLTILIALALSTHTLSINGNCKLFKIIKIMKIVKTKLAI